MKQLINLNSIPDQEEIVEDARAGAQSSDLYLAASETLDTRR